jgi:quercetin dioxygenase-like cupin family protein
MSQADNRPYRFDDRNTTWYPLGDLQHLVFSLLNLDVADEAVDFIVKFDANERIVLHRHLSHTNTFVVQGEHRLYEPDGQLKEVRATGTFTSSPPGGPHYEGGGDEECVVLYNIRGAVGGQMFEIMDDDEQVVAMLGMEDLKAAWAEQKKL